MQAALLELESGGPQSVSVRSVARRLDVDPKSLYNHVDGKDGLLDAVAEDFLATMTLPAPRGDLAADTRAFAHAFRRHALRHPRAASLVLTRQTRSPESLVPVDAALSVLLRAGFGPREAVRVLRTLLAALIGMVLREVEAGPTFGTSDADAIDRRRVVIEGAGLPCTDAAAADLARFDAEAEFAHGVDLLVTATLQRLDQEIS